MEHVLLDWTLPWWAGIVVYVVVGVGWLLCFYTTILYGVKFTDDEVCFPHAHARDRSMHAWQMPADSRHVPACMRAGARSRHPFPAVFDPATGFPSLITIQADAWLSSFAISVVLSAVVLQSLRAIATGFLAVIVASTAVVATIAAFGLGTNVGAMAAGP